MSIRSYISRNIRYGIILGIIGIILFLIILIFETFYKKKPDYYIYEIKYGKVHSAYYCKNKEAFETLKFFYTDSTASIRTGLKIKSMPIGTEVKLVGRKSGDRLRFFVLTDSSNVAKYTSGYVYKTTVHNNPPRNNDN